MSRAVFLGFPYYGHTHPSLPVVKELARRGEEIIYYSIEEFRPKIESAGAIFRGYRIPRMEIVEQPLAGFTLADLQKGARGIYDLNTTIDGFVNNLALYLEIMKESPVDLTREIKELAPDYIIHDSYAYWGKVIAKRLGIPAIASVTIFAYCDRIYEEQPAFVIKNILSMSDDYLIDIEATRKMLKRVCRVIENLYNIDGYDCIDRNFSLEALNIVYTSKEFQLFSELFDDSRFKFVGPSLLPGDGDQVSPVVKGPGEKLLYISLGSVFSNAYDYTSFYRNCFEAFGGSDLKVALSVGKVDIKSLGEIPPNFTVQAFFPQLSILAQADLFISHAGINSVHEALYHDVPLIVIPQGWDQFLVAGRVEELGAGIYLRDFQFTASELKQAVAQVFSNESYRENCQKVGATLRNAGGYKLAADEILAFIMKGQN